MTRRQTQASLCFPQLQHVAVKNFSLYTQRRKIELDVADGVVCLAGANGIGKSTFLSAVNFALTGIVPSATRKFESAGEYLEDGVKFSEAFFEGRIDEDDRDEAEITLSFKIDKYDFEITRGLFEPGELRSLKVALDGASQVKPGVSSAGDRHRVYCEQVAKAVGVKAFDQFVFLQHFVFTFDESRHLLFWDPRALEQALYLAFGGDAEVAAQASGLRREMEKADSRGRNIQFHASTVYSRIETIEEALQETDDKGDIADLREQHEALVDTRDAVEKEVDKVEAKAADAEVALAEASAATVSLRKDYETAFGKLTGRRSIVDSHPLVRETIENERCGLCGTDEPEAVAHLKDALKRHRCPLCESQLQKSGAGHADVLAGLKKIDSALEKARGKLESAATTRSRLAKEKEQAQDRFSKAEGALRAFEGKHEKRLAKAGGKLSGASGLALSLANLRTEHETLRAKRKDAYAKRDEFKKQLKTLQKKLEASYAAAEEDFVPLFRKLADLFLGIELDIRLEGKAASGLTLVLELRNTVRREHHQLSESQRFFVDIALRMALAQFMSGKRAPAGLLIDTPEGSLDIAYESRAGEMFAQFVKGGHRLMMTANINSSQLLLKLAGECGSKRMELVKMTSWTDLSEVQIKESKLFQDAYGLIEKKLRGANA